MFKRGARQGASLGAEDAEAAKPRIFGRGDCFAIFSPIGFFKLNEFLFNRPIVTSGARKGASLGAKGAEAAKPRAGGATIASQFFLP